MNQSLKGKVALVTGGTKGIGKAIADKLGNCGVEVIVVARTKPKDNINKHYFIPADLAQAESAGIIAKEIIDTYSKIDIIVNNAGANLTQKGDIVSFPIRIGTMNYS